VSIEHSERPVEAGTDPSVGSVGDRYDNALAGTINGLCQTGVIGRCGPWRSLGAVELATLERVGWFNNRRLLEPIGNIPPAAAEARSHAQHEEPALAAEDPTETASGKPGRFNALKDRQRERPDLFRKRAYNHAGCAMRSPSQPGFLFFRALFAVQQSIVKGRSLGRGARLILCFTHEFVTYFGEQRQAAIQRQKQHAGNHAGKTHGNPERFAHAETSECRQPASRDIYPPNGSKNKQCLSPSIASQELGAIKHQRWRRISLSHVDQLGLSSQRLPACASRQSSLPTGYRQQAWQSC